MAIHASTVAAILAGPLAEASREAAAAGERREVKAAAQEAAAASEARAAQEALAKSEADMQTLEQALAQERARKEAEIKAQVDAAKREAIETAQQKVAEEKARTEVQLGALGAEKAGLQLQRERVAPRAQEEAERRAVEATASAMEEPERNIRREMLPGGSGVDTLRRFFDGDPASRM